MTAAEIRRLREALAAAEAERDAARAGALAEAAAIAEEKRDQWRSAGGFGGHSAAANIIADQIRAILSDAPAPAPAAVPAEVRGVTSEGDPCECPGGSTYGIEGSGWRRCDLCGGLVPPEQSPAPAPAAVPAEVREALRFYAGEWASVWEDVRTGSGWEADKVTTEPTESLLDDRGDRARAALARLPAAPAAEVPAEVREALGRLLRAIDAERAAWTAYLNTPVDRGGRSGPQGKAVKAWHVAKAEVDDARATLARLNAADGGERGR